MKIMKSLLSAALIVGSGLLLNATPPVSQAASARQLSTRMNAQETPADIAITGGPSRILANGDFNGDGADDFLVEYNKQEGNPPLVTFQKFGLIFGKRSQTSVTTIDLTRDEPDVSLTTEIKGAAGISRIANLGDLNLDGIDDLALTQTHPDQKDARGAPLLKVFFGSRQLKPGVLDLDALRPDLTIIPDMRNLTYTEELLGVADLNADGINDLVLVDNDNYFFFALPILFGPFGAGETIELKSRKPDVVISSWNYSETIKASEVLLCDVNGDRITDVVLKKSRFDVPYDLDQVRILDVSNYTFVDVVLGSPNLKRGEILLLQGEGDATISTRTNPSVFAAGDINGDGIDDLVCGDSFANKSSFSGWASGYVYVILGGPKPPNGPGCCPQADIIISGLPIPEGFKPVPGVSFGDRLAASIAVGDIDGDGISDILLGAPGQTLDASGRPAPLNRAHVMLGSRELKRDAHIQLGREQQDLTISFDAKTAGVGKVVRCGDFNGDGVSDMLVANEATSYVFFGGSVRPPVITKAKYASGREELSISGSEFTGSARVEVNGVISGRLVTFDPENGSLSLRAGFSELNLQDGKNRVAVIRNGVRSNTLKIKVR